MMGLTTAQADCLRAIRDLTFDGVPPTLEELRVHLGLSSKGGVHALLVELRDRGAVQWRPRSPRSLVVTEDQVSAAALLGLPSDTLRITAARIAGILAQRDGSKPTAEAFHRIADKLPGEGRRAA